MLVDACFPTDSWTAGITYHVANLGGATGIDEDHTGAVGRAAGLEIVAGGGQLASLDRGSSGEGGNEASGREDLEELHFCGGGGCLLTEMGLANKRCC